MEKFRGKYRTTSTRARFWNYGWNAAYFVTINTRYQECFFGDVTNNSMVLSELGKSAEKCWLAIPEHFPFVKLDVHVVMPNHVHGIIWIEKPGRPIATIPPIDYFLLETEDEGKSAEEKASTLNRFGPQSKNLGSIIRGFKIGVTNSAKDLTLPFGWQDLYHDHIIRTPESYAKIKNYILSNPANWEEDKFYIKPKSLWFPDANT